MFDEEDKKGDNLDSCECDIKSNNIRLQEAEILYNKLNMNYETFNEQFWYVVCMDEKDDLTILKHTSQVRFPKIKALKILQPPPKIDSCLENLMRYSFQNSLK